MAPPIISNVDGTVTKHASDVTSIKLNCTAWLNDAAAMTGDTLSGVNCTSILGTVTGTLQTQNASELIVYLSGGNPGQADTVDIMVDSAMGRRETFRLRVNVLV
jgi:hypothetical protein